MELAEIKAYLKTSITSLRDRGYMRLDLVKACIFTVEEIQEMQEICMSEYYKFFTDKGIDPTSIQIDLKNEMKTNPYFKQPKDSEMFKAMYGQKNE